MMNRKTKRHSPPPYQTTISSSLDHKVSLDSFSKWSKVLQLLSPPHKKRRAGMSLMETPEEEDWSSSSSDEEEEEQVAPVLKRERSIDQINKERRSLHRRAIYIPNTTTIITDGPKDAFHQWTLYRATHQKLRRNTLPLLESLHLRKMLATLHTSLGTSNKIAEDEEDNVPLGTLLEKNVKRPSSPPRPQLKTNNKMVVPPSATMKAFYNNSKRPQLLQPHKSPQKPIYYQNQRQPYFYNSNNRLFFSPSVQYTTTSSF